MYANLDVMYENVLFRCTSLGSFDIAVKRVDKFEIWWKIHDQELIYLQF